MTKLAEPRFIESTAGQVAAERARRGIAPDRHVTITSEPDDWLPEMRRYARGRVVGPRLRGTPAQQCGTRLFRAIAFRG